MTPTDLHVDPEAQADLAAIRQLELSTGAPHDTPRLLSLMAVRRRARTAWDPGLDRAAIDRLRAVEAEAELAIVDSSIESQRLHRRRADDRHSRIYFVHPGGHMGPCPEPRTMQMSEAELRPLAGTGVWHLDPSQDRPNWFPLPLLHAMAHSSTA